MRAASRRSSAASRSWSASTALPRPSPRRSPTRRDAILTVSDDAEADQIERLEAWRAARDGEAVAAALDGSAHGGEERRNIMPASIACAKAGVTTGEWGFALR